MDKIEKTFIITKRFKAKNAAQAIRKEKKEPVYEVSVEEPEPEKKEKMGY